MINFDNKKLYTLVFIIGFLVPLFFTLYTDHAWEDWYITYRASKNLAIGNGLVFTVGERVHTFTSPLGTLVPALLNFITRNYSDDLVLWLFRLLNCGLLGLSAVLLVKMARHLNFNYLAIIFLVAMLLFDLKTIDFSTNGMETAMMIFFLALLLYSQFMPFKRSFVIIGISWAGLMWSRPDSFIYIIAISLGMLLFNPPLPLAQTRLQRIKEYLLAGMITTALYAPWLIWAWSYYGSFIPNTVVAKGLSFGSEPKSAQAISLIKQILQFPFISTISETSFDRIFMPVYALEGVNRDWPLYCQGLSRLLSWVASFIWIVPFVDRSTRAISVAVLIGNLYLNFMLVLIFPWYVPSVAFLTIYVWTLLINQIINKLNRLNQESDRATSPLLKGAKLLITPAMVTIILICFSMLLMGASQMYIQQTVIENGNRKQIGLWLHDNAKPTDRVFLECLGYIGFYSELKTYDFPGLSAPEVIAARRTLKTNDFGLLIDYLKPEWVVIRPTELDMFNNQSLAALQNYSLVKTFDVSPILDSYSYIPGKSYLRYDQTFLVLHINKATSQH